MKLPISWLREWVDVDADAAAIADALTRRGFYVEGIETTGVAYPGVVVARVLDVARHPNADRLSLCRVDAGSGPVSVVCGAPNVRAGMVAALATVGAKLPGGAIIRRSKIRGEDSEGMLCSARELQLSDEHEGILDLEAYAADGGTPRPLPALGQPIQPLMPAADAVLEIEVPFNRPDGLGIVGLAREVKAALGGQWTDAARARLAATWTPAGAAFPVALEDTEGCPLYMAQAIERITIGPSPRWLIDRLARVGQRSINNVVDLTNLVLHELGQPMHAFDLARLSGPEIRVRRARAGEKLVTLDGKERALTPEVLVIADRERPVALAGVMGGADSEVGDSTTALLLECAWFEPRRVRRGAKTLGLTTEASKRFERGVDPAIGPAALARFLELLAQLVPDMQRGVAGQGGAVVASGAPLTLRRSRVARLTGVDLDTEPAAQLLRALEFDVTPGRVADTLDVRVPSFRRDVALEDDLVEEVARAHGYDRIPEAPLDTRGAFALRSRREAVVGAARRAMLARGLNEAWTTTLVSEREAHATAPLIDHALESVVRLANPMSRESEALRPSPVPGLLRAVAHNLRQGVRGVRLFEVGAGFGWDDDRASREPRLPEETLMLAAVITGPLWSHAHEPSRARDAVDFHAAKGLWEGWLGEMRVDALEWRSYAAPGWKPGASAEVVGTTSRIAWAGELAPPLLREWDIEVPVQLFVALLDPFLAATEARPAVRLPGRFPPVRRDLAFFVPQTVTHRQVERTLAGAAGERLASIELFDVYQGPQSPPGMKSLAYAIAFQHPERTLAEAEIQAVQDRMVAAVARECGGHLREQR